MSKAFIQLQQFAYDLTCKNQVIRKFAKKAVETLTGDAKCKTQS